jgi:hypothetical protein
MVTQGGCADLPAAALEYWTVKPGKLKVYRKSSDTFTSDIADTLAGSGRC